MVLLHSSCIGGCVGQFSCGKSIPLHFCNKRHAAGLFYNPVCHNFLPGFSWRQSTDLKKLIGAAICICWSCCCHLFKYSCKWQSMREQPSERGFCLWLLGLFSMLPAMLVRFCERHPHILINLEGNHTMQRRWKQPDTLRRAQDFLLEHAAYKASDWKD